MGKRPMTSRELLRRDWPSMLIGSALGIAIAGYFFVYSPMKANYDKCGQITVCRAATAKDDR